MAFACSHEPSLAAALRIPTDTERRKTGLFDQLVGTCEQDAWYLEAERVDSLHIDNEFKRSRLLDWNIGWLHSIQDLVDDLGCAPPHAWPLGAIGHEPA